MCCTIESAVHLCQRSIYNCSTSIGIAAHDREHALREQVIERMIDLGGLATVEQVPGHAGNQTVALLSSLQQYRSAIGTALPLIKFSGNRPGKNLWKQQALCRGRIG
jgi:hypothetical protein